MKNVMTRAWEIARTAKVRYGGKVSEYMAAALRQAWSEVLNSKRVGMIETTKRNGILYFALEGTVSDVAAAYYTNERSRYNGKAYTKRHAMEPTHTGHHKASGKPVVVYQIGLGEQVLEIRNGANVAKLAINRGKLEWVS